MVRKTKLEREVRENKMDYKCFRCKEIISIDEKQCPKCSFITIYGSRKKKEWYIFVLLIGWLFVVIKFFRQGLL